MRKKVLVFSSTPRKGGNSDLLCDQFIKGAQDFGHQTEKIFLKNVNINFCTGCGVCLNGKQRCPQKDDMPEILEKMITSDVIVMATPVYFYTMCAQMKTLIDRVCSRYTEIRNKDFYFLMTAADNNKDSLVRTLEGFRGFTSCLDGANEKGVVYGAGAWNIGDIHETPAMKEAYAMGKNI